MVTFRAFAVASVTLVTALTAAACAADDAVTAPPSVLTISAEDGASIAAGTLRLRCELRVGRSSKISVDAKNISPLNGIFRSGVRSGGVTVTHGP
ncbi:MAG: hypothetical protein ABI877_08870, partial [Gemmatimonadaceae bacterium]